MRFNIDDTNSDGIRNLKTGVLLLNLTLVATLSALMLLTRGSHFSGFNALPEASWMIFMVAGTLLPIWSFAWFMSLAVGIDAYAFTFGGVPGTCFSVAYAMLIPAYFSMWVAGRLSKFYLTGEPAASRYSLDSRCSGPLFVNLSPAVVFTFGPGTLSQPSVNF